MRAPDNHRELIIDDTAADTVKLVFAWAADGVNTSEIARKLNIQQIPSPGSHRGTAETENIGIWYASTVKKILENEIYLGHLVQGKTKSVRFQRQSTPSDEWIRVNNTHDAIVSPDVFQTVQTLRHNSLESKKDRPLTPYSANIYKGKIYCADCAGRMERTINHKTYIFRCVSNRTAKGSCPGNRISENTIAQMLLEQLSHYRDELFRQHDKPSNKVEILQELRFIDMELNHAKNLTRSLYESLVTGIINKADYIELKSGYQNKKDEYFKRANSLQKVLDDEKDANKHRQESLEILNKLIDTPILTPEHIDRFVSRVVIFREGRVHFELAKE
jgi:hypothetical protein